MNLSVSTIPWQHLKRLDKLGYIVLHTFLCWVHAWNSEAEGDNHSPNSNEPPAEVSSQGRRSGTIHGMSCTGPFLFVVFSTYPLGWGLAQKDTTHCSHSHTSTEGEEQYDCKYHVPMWLAPIEYSLVLSTVLLWGLCKQDCCNDRRPACDNTDESLFAETEQPS